MRGNDTYGDGIIINFLDNNASLWPYKAIEYERRMKIIHQK